MKETVPESSFRKTAPNNDLGLTAEETKIFNMNSNAMHFKRFSNMLKDLQELLESSKHIHYFLSTKLL